jgi:hypothetical protein
MKQQNRIDGIDFWRGCVLCMILIDHMPGNAFENLTPRNFGFSDAAEAFVFLSGVSIALAYGKRFSIGQRLQTLRGLARRELKLYGAHIGLSLAALTIFFAGAAWAGKPDLLEVHGRDLFVDNPGLGLLGLASLGHQLGYFNILPLYIILIACAPALIWLAAIDRRLMLCCSGLLYALSRLYGWNLPNWPAPGVWFFDPFAWQLLFAIGIALGLDRRDGAPLFSRPLIAVAGLILAASAVAVTQGFGMAREAWESLRGALDIDKSQLGLVRLVHFLALTYLIHGLRLTDRLRDLRFYRPLALLGRHSLWVFVLLSLFSAIWQVLVEAVNRTIAFDLVFVGASLAIIYLATRLIDTNSANAQPTDIPASRIPAKPDAILVGASCRDFGAR